MGETYCSRCGEKNLDGAAFCARCGEKLVSPGEPQVEVPSPEFKVAREAAAGYPLPPQPVKEEPSPLSTGEIIGFGCLTLLIPLVGLIFGIIWTTGKRRGAVGFLVYSIILMFAFPAVLLFSAIAVPTLVSTRSAAMKSYAHGEASTIRSRQAAYYAQNGVYGSAAELVEGEYLDSYFHPWVPGDHKNVTMTWENTDDSFTVTFTIPDPPAGESGIFSVDQSGLITYDGEPA